MIKYIYIVCVLNNNTIYSTLHYMKYSIQRGEIYMKIIKRSGSEDIFDAAKIVAAIRKATMRSLLLIRLRKLQATWRLHVRT